MARELLMGNEAFAHAALEAGVRVVAGYPGTPSSELIETVAKLHGAGAARGVHVEWSTNEKAALEVLAGAAYCGARTLFTCKQVGLNVASDPLMSLNYIGVKGGTVLFVADDPGPISSQTEQDTRRFAAFAKVPVLDPATPEQGFAMMQAAFDLSERYRTPVIVRPTTRICHASTFFDVAEATDARPVPEEGFERDPKWIIFPRRAFQAHGEINDRLRAMAHDFAAEPVLAAFNPMLEGGTVRTAPALGIVAGGVSAAYAREALRMVEQRAAAAGVAVPAYRFWQVGTPYPFPEEQAARFAEGLEQVLVLEELDHVLEDALCAFAGRAHAPFGVLGKLTGHARDRGENDVDDIAGRIAAFFGLSAECGAPGQEASAAPVHDNSPEMLRNRRFSTSQVPDSPVSKASCEETPGQKNPSIEDRAQAPEKTSDNVKNRRFLSISDEKTGHAQAAEPDGAACAQQNAALRSSAASGQTGSAPGQATVSPEGAVAAPRAYEAPADDPLPVRPPVLCAGCPHRGSFYAVKQALGSTPAVLCGDIGCYTLGNAKPLDAVDTCLCMGAGITMAQGFAVAEPQKKCLAFVGDSTFFASGLTGIVNAVYNGHDITVCVLDNATTAMTGSQPHPGTGVTLMGDRRAPVSIRKVLEAVGVACIEQADPLDLDTSVQAAKRAIAFDGPSAILFESPCVQLRKPGEPVRINPDACTGCKRCITEIGCPGIGFDPDAQGPKSKGRGQAFIDPGLCNGCRLCTQVCPFDAIMPAAAAFGADEPLEEGAR